MPETRRNKRKNLRGGMGSEDENTIRTTRLLIVNNALEASVLGGANLFSAPEWTVVCNSGDHDGGEIPFYKNMSKMGIYEYYYGYGANNSILKKLACKSWCLLATTNSELVPLIQDVFMQEPDVISVTNTMLSAKLNRFKTVLVKQNEKLFEKEESNQTGGQHGGLLTSDTVTSIQKTFESNETPEVFAEFLTRGMFTVKDILTKMNEKVKVKTPDGTEHEVYNNILYLPETTSNKNITSLKSFLEKPFSRQMDMLFFDNRPTPTISEQYFYKIDLDEPIIIRTNDTTRKMIALLDTIDELESFFLEGYQFLSSLRITPLNFTPSYTMPVKQEGGQQDEFLDLFDELKLDEGELSQNPFMALIHPTIKEQTSSMEETLVEETPIESVVPEAQTSEPIEPVVPEVQTIVPNSQPIQPVVSETLSLPTGQSIIPEVQPTAQPVQQGGKQKRRTIKQRKYKANSH